MTFQYVINTQGRLLSKQNKQYPYRIQIKHTRNKEKRWTGIGINLAFAIQSLKFNILIHDGKRFFKVRALIPPLHIIRYAIKKNGEHIEFNTKSSKYFIKLNIFKNSPLSSVVDETQLIRGATFDIFNRVVYFYDYFKYNKLLTKNGLKYYNKGKKNDDNFVIKRFRNIKAHVTHEKLLNIITKANNIYALRDYDDKKPPGIPQISFSFVNDI